MRQACAWQALLAWQACAWLAWMAWQACACQARMGRCEAGVCVAGLAGVCVSGEDGEV